MTPSSFRTVTGPLASALPWRTLSCRARRAGVLMTVTRPALLPALLLALLLTLPGRAVAQDGGLPAWAVLVLQPVGDKRVRPVTGVVVTADGAVVVPADFAAPGDVLIVLDGGTDVMEHGRAATVRAHDPAAGIAVLDVRGLARAPARLAAAPPQPDDLLRLAAFPPAEQIAEGAAPLSRPARTADLLDAAAGPLPNVSGPLLDGCGHLAGYAMAAGLPAMEPAADTRYAWSDILAAALAAAGVEVAREPCDAPGVIEDAPAAAGEVTAGAIADEQGALEEAAAEDATPFAEDAGRAEPAGTGSVPAPGGNRMDTWMQRATSIVAAAVAAALAFLAWRLGRRRRPAAPGLLEDTVVRRSARPSRGAAVAGESAAGAGWTLELRGQLASGASFTRRCVVNPAAIDVVIGSGDAESGTDIAIDAPGIARQHARLGGSAGAVTISDLAGGTWIGRVPCQRGEIMFLADGDSVSLGESSFRVRLVPPGESGD